jgi:cyclic-di-AMP phosphodiesterase PgpH
LVAPFDFAIHKSNFEITGEKADIVNNSKPYFKIDKSIANSKRKQLEVSISKIDLQNVIKEKWINIGNAIIDTIYGRGIIQQAEVLENQNKITSIFILDNNTAEERDLQSFFTIQSAFDFVEQQVKTKLKNLRDFEIIQLIQNCLEQNVVYDDGTTKKVMQQAIDNIATTRDLILKDQIIVSKGEIVDDLKYTILQSMKEEYEGKNTGNKNFWILLAGQSILVTISFIVLICFLAFFRKDIFMDNAKVVFILLLIVLQVLMARLAISSNSFSIYILPFSILPIIIRAFYDTRVALFVHLVTVLIISFITTERFEFAFIQLTAGMVAIFSIVNMSNRSQIFISSTLIFLTYAISYIGISFIHEGAEEGILLTEIGWFGISSLLTLFSYPLIFVFENLFGFTSDVSLLELSNTNRKLLRELASKAPGTFQHSLQVANLAEEAIRTIGGNALLVRTGALYHDVGKMEMPLYFTENQPPGVNPHEDVNFEESAAIIIDHVIRGIEIAKKNNLPEQVIDFIRTHHGTTITAYFYRSFQNEFPEEKIEEAKFHYPGPIPFSKETAVLMMADSVEAASRSLKKYDAESIDNLVNKIIDSQIEQNQFLNADITFRDINQLKRFFKKKLMNIYHVRVEYPR